MMGVDLGRGGRPLRIACGRIFHEANAYSPLLTERSDFERMHHLSGAELGEVLTLGRSELKSFMPHAELTGFAQAARLAGGVEVVPLSSSLAVPNGPVSATCFGWLLDGLLERLAGAGPVDGVYLALHGSMQVDGLARAPEAVIIERVRELVGDGVKIAVSFDLHANLSPGMVDPIDVLVGYRTNPHWDLAPTGFRAGNRLIRALRDRCRPTHAWRKLPMVLGGGTTIDFLAPMRGVFRRMKRMERDPRVLTASLFMVHPYTAADDLGWAAHVCTDGDEELADRLADELADLAWAQRNEELPPMRTIEEALDEVSSSLWRKLGPVSLVDVGDVVGAGAPGGSTRIAEALVRDDRGLESLVPVHDPALVAAAWDDAVGTRRRFTLAGTPGYEQPEVELAATVAVKATTDFGRTVRLDSGGLHLAVTERSPLPIHPSFWRQVSLSPRQADLIVQKNFFHYRMFYATTSFRHIPVVSEGATSLDRVRERAYRVPVHPQVALTDWREHDAELRNANADWSSEATAARPTA
jgi:microcystin degradation protein MlrC